MAGDQSPVDTGMDVSAHFATRDIAVVCPTGDIDSATSGPLRAAIGEQVAAGARHVVLDLSGVAFLGSAGLAVLIAERESAIERGGALRLAGVPRVAGRALSLTGLTELFETDADADTAVAYLEGAHPGDHG